MEISRTVRFILMYLRHKTVDRVSLLGSQQRPNVFSVRYEHYPSCVLNKRQDDG
jgi:hypothetical protein